MGYRFVWTGKGFGNALLMAHLTRIVVDNGVPAVFQQHAKTVGLVDVPLYDKENEEHQKYDTHTLLGIRNSYLKKNCDKPAIVQYMNYARAVTGIYMRFIDQLHSFIPVLFENDPTIQGYDVVMCTRTGAWGPYREWSYFEELKDLLKASAISYIDLHEHNIMGNECLNYVKRCKVYLGLETGMSHYVSKFASGKALILQSGFCNFNYWAYAYDYQFMKVDVDCQWRPCFINKNDIKAGVTCPHDVACMKQLSASDVLTTVMEML